jgi:hypothetical protein
VRLGPVSGFAGADDTKVLPELVPQLWDSSKRLAQAGIRTGHATVIPDDLAEFFMERIGAAFSMNCEQLMDSILYLGFVVLNSGWEGSAGSSLLEAMQSRTVHGMMK